MNVTEVTENKMEDKINWIERISNENVNAEEKERLIKLEQENVIEKLEEVLKFLKARQINDEEPLGLIKQPLDDIRASLKYFPAEQSFDLFPTEIKTKILSYTCDSGAFIAASVCLEWKGILQKRLKSLERVNIGKHCSKLDKCEDYKCFIPEAMLKASITLELDIPLCICHPVTDVDSELISEALTNVSNIILGKINEYGQIMTDEQFSELFESLEYKNKILDSMELVNLDLSDLDQDRLVNCFLTKIKKLTLNYVLTLDSARDTLIRKLLEDSSDFKLQYLSINHLDLSDELSDQQAQDLADGLCKIESINLPESINFNIVTANRMITNILNREIKMKAFNMGKILMWRGLDPRDLKKMLVKMEVLALSGRFDLEHLEVARSVPGVQTISLDGGYFTIQKGCIQEYVARIIR